MNELITIIINVYNNEKFIAKCIESVINQSYRNLEILIVNDGSTDNTLSICKGYKDKRIKIISTDNLGLSLSRNIGIENSNGNYLYFVDSDDYIEKDTIEYLYNLCNKYDCNFSTCKALTIFDYNFIVKNKKEHIKVLSKKDMLIKVLMFEDCNTTIWNKLLKKDFFDNLRFEDRVINDILVTYKLVLKSSKIVYSNQKKYYYLKHRNAVTVNKKGENMNRVRDYYSAIMERYNDVKKIYPNFIENDVAVLRGILQLYIIENEDVEEFLKEKNVKKLFNKMFSLKMLFSKVRFKEKIKLLLFRVSAKNYKKIGNYYRKCKYKYKM